MTEYVGITGIGDGTNGDAVPLRLEIRELIANPDLLNVYLLALRRMQSLPKTDTLSWYQIAGIHGRPYTAWDNVTGNGNSAGYCTHSSILFLPWHRPYLALFEQTLYANAKAAIAAFPAGAAKDKYTRILPSFRIPYWDFAADPVLPDIVLNQKTVQVVTATGPQTINNPLYSYNFGTINRSDFPYTPQNVWLNTLRQPGTANRPSPNDSSRPQAVASALASFSSTPSFPPRPGKPILNLRDRVYALLSKNNYQNFQYFSNDGWNNNNNPDDYDSLESIHNNIHVLVGGDGHMSDPAYAGFDPIFWLHHCNVDRIFAIWQVLNPDSYVVDQQAANSTFWSNGTDNPNVDPTIEGPQSDLVPFHQDDSTYWLSETVRNLKTFGSTYPELVDWGVVSPAQVQSNVQAAVQHLYGKTAPVHRVLGGFSSILASAFAPARARDDQSDVGIPQNDGAGDEEPHSSHHHHHLHHHHHGHADSSSQEPQHRIGSGPNLIHHNQYHEYFANLRVEKYALSGSFNVHVFMGSFSDDPVQRVSDDNLVGTFSVFANDPHTTGCEKCKSDAKNKLIVTASIPLTGALLDRIPDDAIPELQSLAPEAVVPFLTKHLHWRINKADDTPVSRDEVLSLKVGVASVIVDVQEGAGNLPIHARELPTYRDWKQLYEVTRGRRRGIEDDDDL